MHQLADEFQAAVGAIVDTVSAASTELEAAAGTLTKTAEVTQELSGRSRPRPSRPPPTCSPSRPPPRR